MNKRPIERNSQEKKEKNPSTSIPKGVRRVKAKRKRRREANTGAVTDEKSHLRKEDMVILHDTENKRITFLP